LCSVEQATNLVDRVNVDEWVSVSMKTFPRIAFAPEEFCDAQVPTCHVFAITESDRSALDHHEPGNITGSTAVDQFNITGTLLPETAEDSLLFRRHRTCVTRTAEWAHERCAIRERVSRRVSVDPREMIALASFEELLHNLTRLVHAPRLPAMCSCRQRLHRDRTSPAQCGSYA
jgi:hypothetical protein